jgi:hypothetical protein
MPRGPVFAPPTPHHSGTDDFPEGGPLWLQVQAYGYPLFLCQDHKRVLTTAALVTTRTAFPPQVSAVTWASGDVGIGGDGGSCATR